VRPVIAKNVKKQRNEAKTDDIGQHEASLRHAFPVTQLRKPFCHGFFRPSLVPAS